MSKWRNRKTVYNGVAFDSIKECNRYKELELLQLAGVISNLKLQPRYVLQEGYKRIDGKRIRAITYVADFEYRDCETGEIVTEDVKGAQTQVFRLKCKLFEKKFGRVIRIT